jgi:hypothetical protein
MGEWALQARTRRKINVTLLEIHPPNKRRSVALVCVFAALLAACDLGGQAAAPAATTPARATEPAAESTPKMTPAEGVMTEPAIIDFKVYQDFMPMVPASGPPLHAAVTLEVIIKPGQPAANASGTITITRPAGELIATADLTQSQQPDDLSLRRPGSQQLVLTTKGIPISAKLTEGETLQGSARVILGGRSFDLKLPQTQVVFTH